MDKIFNIDNFKNLSEEEKKKIISNAIGNHSERPMGEIYPKFIKRILDGESPRTTISLYTGSNSKDLERDAEKEEKHKIFENLRKELNPTFCPKCKKLMKGKLDKKIYKIRSTCFDCLLKYERKIRDLNLWQEYEDRIMTQNKLSYLRDVKQEIEDYLNSGLKLEYEYVTEDGKIEKWVNESYYETKKFLEHTLKDINNIIKDLSEYLEELNQKLIIIDNIENE